MHIVVCIKQVPDSTQIRVHPTTNTIMRQGVPAIINPYDLFALEQALRVRDEVGGSITAVTMGPPMAETSLRRALAYGVDRAVLLTDRFFAGSDTLATSYALAAAITKIGDMWGEPTLVFTGKQTIDGDTAQVGPGIAKRLGLTPLTYVSAIRDTGVRKGERIVVDRRAEGGTQRLEAKLPALVTVLESEMEMRRGSFEDALRAATTEVVRWSAKDAGIEDMLKCGLRGSPTVVKKVYAPSARSETAEHITVDSGDVNDLADNLWSRIFERNPSLEDELVRS